MKSPRFLGQMLALCLLILAVAAVPSTAIGPQHAASVPTSEVAILHKEASSFRLSASSYPVMEVRQVLERGLAATGRLALDSRTAHLTLSRLYGSRLSETTVPMGYAWVWDPVLERWVIVCTSVSTFEVDFAARGTVRVEIRESERVP